MHLIVVKETHIQCVSFFGNILQVPVYLQNLCNRPIDVILVLMSREPTNWILKYGCLERKDTSCDDSQSMQRDINLTEAYVS